MLYRMVGTGSGSVSLLFDASRLKMQGGIRSTDRSMPERIARILTDTRTCVNSSADAHREASVSSGKNVFDCAHFSIESWNQIDNLFRSMLSSQMRLSMPA